MPRTISLLDRVQIASPCPMKWEDMVGDDRKRFCGECQLNVYNIRAMTRSDAEALILGAEGRLCFQLYRRTDGTVLTADCPVGLRRVRAGVARFARLVLAACAAAVAIVCQMYGAKSPGVSLDQLEPVRATLDWLSPPVIPTFTGGSVIWMPPPTATTQPGVQTDELTPADPNPAQP